MFGWVKRWLGGLFRKSASEQDLDDELRYHLERDTERYTAGGMTPEDAERTARRGFGNVELWKEQSRDARGTRLVDDLLTDAKYTIRYLCRRPGFTTAAVLILALGTGPNVAMFSVVRATLLAPLPYQDVDRLVMIESRAGGVTGTGEPWIQIHPFLYWKEHTQALERIAALDWKTFHLSGSSEPERVSGAYISHDYFALLGVQPMLGRTIRRDEEHPGSARVALIGENLWRRRFGADPGILGRALSIDGQRHVVIGVMPAGSQFFTTQDSMGSLQNTELWLPLIPAARVQAAENDRYVSIVATLRPGVSIDTAQAELDALIRDFKTNHPGTFPDDPRWTGLQLTRVMNEVVHHYRPTLLALQAAAGFVLLIACVNVASLLLARSVTRQRELAVRTALGASRLRLMQLSLIEGCLLSVSAGLTGLLLAQWVLQLFTAQIPPDIPAVDKIGLDLTVFGFMLAVALLTGIVFAVIPTITGDKMKPADALKEGSATSSGSRRRHRILSVLVVTELAAAVVLLIGAGLMLRTLLRLEQIDPGFYPKDIVTVSVEFPEHRTSSEKALTELYSETLERIQTLPGVGAVGATEDLPIRAGGSSRGIMLNGASEQRVAPTWDVVSPDYFATMRIPLKVGRYLSDQDQRESSLVVVINETMAHRYWPGASPLGQQLQAMSSEPGPNPNPWLTIVGVVGDVKRSGLHTDTEPGVFVPYHQHLRDDQAPGRRWTLVIRTFGNESTMGARVRRELQTIDPELVVTDAASMDDVLATSLSAWRFRRALLGAMATLALVLSAAGIYGVMMFAITHRTQEIGIRMAMGARPSQILRMVMANGLRLAIAGVTIGLAGAWGMSGLFSAFVFGITPTDSTSFLWVTGIVFTVALLAAYIPGRRASRIDPLYALRRP